MITPQQEAPQLAQALGLKGKLYLKREDLHPLGSHKGRSIPYMIEQYAKGGASKFAISSSGNAALAAAKYIKEYNQKFSERPLSLQIFVGENVNKEKRAMIEAEADSDTQISVTQTDKPKQTVHVLNKKGEAKALRQSNDPLALVGYRSLVEELSELGELAAIFVPTSSGTTAEALAAKFPVHIVQTAKCHPLAEQFDTNFTPATESLADAIVDTVALRQNSLDKLLMKSGGGWVVSNDEIRAAQEIVRVSCNLDISPNAALSVAGLSKALLQNFDPSGTTVCLITGR